MQNIKINMRRLHNRVAAGSRQLAGFPQPKKQVLQVLKVL